MKLKICGMREPENIRAVAALGPDYMGFIFYPLSPRYAGDLSPESVRALPRPIRRVGVFVNETEQQVIRTAVHYLLDYAQLHGDETPEECRRLNRILPVIKAIAVRTEADLAETQRYEGCCTALLFDTKTERFGGSGRRFDWNILNAYSGETPFLLSGGIGPGDAERLQAVRHPQLAGIDVNSLFESKPGHKECGLLQPFIEQLKTL